MFKYFIFFLALAASIFAQDTTRSEAFKDNQPPKYPIIKAKYPSYSLIAGYVLVTEANRGDQFAQHELGIRYLIGSGFPADTVKAIYWIRKAADQNLAAARFNYGILLYNGIGVPWNPFDGFQNFKVAANAGLPEAQFAVGILYTDNLTLNRDYNKAYHYFRLSADAGYKPAKEALDQLIKSGFSPPTDSLSTKDQKKFASMRAEESSPLINPNWDFDFYDFDKKDKSANTSKQIAALLNKKPEELKRYLGLDELKSAAMPKDTSGMSLLKFAATSGSPEALLIFGRSYQEGVITEKNLVLAAVNYLRAYRLGSYKAGEYLFNMLQSEEFVNTLKERAAKNDPDAMYAWAGISALGFENQISNQQALDFLKKAVDKKHIPSMIEMGLLYSSGKLVQKNKEKALQYWEMAKNLGSKEAAVRIALFDALDSTSTKIADDIKTLMKIADEGSVLAQTALGFCYEKGIGVKENMGFAVKMYRRAAQRGNEAAYNSLKRLYDGIRPYDPQFKIYEPTN
ncbi:MAG: sel1 repeat family protein [Bacteroidetes bacterium]|nr:sel1 repeat family protein [Bacteroidota bacterium]MCL6097679.1 sel1 repeat family protein [Bacteroidota bacterium]